MTLKRLGWSPRGLSWLTDDGLLWGLIAVWSALGVSLLVRMVAVLPVGSPVALVTPFLDVSVEAACPSPKPGPADQKLIFQQSGDTLRP